MRRIRGSAVVPDDGGGPRELDDDSPSFAGATRRKTWLDMSVLFHAIRLVARNMVELGSNSGKSGWPVQSLLASGKHVAQARRRLCVRLGKRPRRGAFGAGGPSRTCLPGHL